MLPIRATYDDLCRDFRWLIPQRFNIGVAISDDWAAHSPERICLQRFDPAGAHEALTYGVLSHRSSAVAAGLASKGVKRGDRVAILLPQGFETVIAHAAIYKLGAIALPLALLFGVDALGYRLRDAGAVALVTNGFGFEKIDLLTDALPDLRLVVLTDGAAGKDTVALADLEQTDWTGFAPLQASPDDPAMMIYTSGTTGPPKGALHGHRVLLGHLPGFQFHHADLPQPGDRMWTPADWAWAGGLLNALLPSLLLGVPVVCSPAQKFDAHMAFRIIEEMQVRNAFIPPTALRLMLAADMRPASDRLSLRSVGSAGEPLGRETCLKASKALGVPVNEFYGQTECNIVLSCAAHLGVTKPGSMGRTVPGHRVEIIDDAGQVMPRGAVGQVAVRRPDPVMFLGYWNNAQATQEKFIGDWMTTGDQGSMDEAGYVTFFGRDDDVITSSGYRIGPSEIEDCLAAHPAVQMAAAIGKPDATRTEIVKAYVVLRSGFTGDDALARDISAWVRTRLSMHEYPREVAFIDRLPMTTSGKIIRRLLRDEAAAEMGIALNATV